MVYSDTETLGLFFRDTSEFEFGKGETSTLCMKSAKPSSITICPPSKQEFPRTTDTDVVSLSRASNDRTQSLQRLSTGSQSLLGSRCPPALLLPRLVEPGLDPSLPVLVLTVLAHSF